MHVRSLSTGVECALAPHQQGSIPNDPLSQGVWYIYREHPSNTVDFTAALSMCVCDIRGELLWATFVLF